MRPMLLMVVMTAAIGAGCADSGTGIRSARVPMDESLHGQRMLVTQRPPIIAAHLPEDLLIARVAAVRADPAALARRESSRWVGVDSLPFLTSTEPGRSFLQAAAPRALARGSPPEACPAVAMAAGSAGGGSAESRAAVAVDALAACQAQLAPGHPDCGCRVVALDDMVTVPREELAYATGASARLRITGRNTDLLLVAEENAAGDTVLRDLAGPVAMILRGPDDTVELQLARDGHRFRGISIPVGFRRGRLAERIYAEDESGARLTLLIGFEPDELAQSAGAWLAWPKGG